MNEQAELDLISGPYNGGPVYTYQNYAVYKLAHQRVAENLTAVWNYAVVNTITQVPEVYTDSYPGALSVAVKLANGTDEMLKHIAEKLAEKESETMGSKRISLDTYRH